MALKMNPDGIDPNYFYGDYLIRRKKYHDAIRFLEIGLEATNKPRRELADAGRRHDIMAAIERAKAKT